MWKARDIEISMAEGDYGIKLPITIHDVEFSSSDSIKITIKKRPNDEEDVLEKTFDGIQDNTIQLELTKQESDKLPVGTYVYRLDWYQNGVFMCNIVLCATFKVVDKA